MQFSKIESKSLESKEIMSIIKSKKKKGVNEKENDNRVICYSGKGLDANIVGPTSVLRT